MTYAEALDDTQSRLAAAAHAALRQYADTLDGDRDQFQRLATYADTLEEWAAKALVEIAETLRARFNITVH